jgi:hypothetical protein
MKQIMEKVKQFLKPVGNWTLFIVSITAAFFVGYYYPTLQKSLNEEPKKFIQPRTQERTSVSVTDRGELLIIDRESGKFDVYEESVGLSVFKAYGTRITSNQPK